MSREAQPTYEFGSFRLDLAEQRLLRHGRPVPLTPKIFEVLRVLVQNRGHLVEKERLLKEVWPDSFVEEGNLNRSVSVLRKALGESSSEQKYIETVPKRGYRFVAPITECLQGSAELVAGERTPALGGSEPTGTDSSSTPTPWAPNSTISISMRAAGIAAGALLTVGVIVYALLGRSEPKRNVVATLEPVHRQVTFTGKEGTPTLSPDGRHIAYLSNESPPKKVMVQELAGGQPIAVFTAPEAGSLRWSPDGSELMFWARGAGTDGVFVVPQLGGSARKVAGGQFLACWSPDGSTIAVARYGVGKISFLNKIGREQTSVSLQGIQRWISDIDWSPANGRLLIVSNDDQGRYAIWTIRPDGSDQKRVFAAKTEIPAARWAPAGDAVYYFRRVDQTVSLYKVFVQPGHRTPEETASPLISGLETDGSFALSADGKHMVYARAPYYSNLWMVEATGSGNGQRIQTTELTHGTSLIERPRVSPDGKSIVFNIGHESLANLYIIPVTGGSPKQLTFLNAFSVGGVWSADGRWVAFASTQGGKPRVWIVNADGGPPHSLSSGDMSDSFEITWSPGSHVLYQQAGNRNFYVLDPRTRQERLLVKDSSVGWIFSPVYSPDGKKIAAAWNRPPNFGIWVIDSKNSRETLVHRTSIPVPIGWSADGTLIYAFEGTRAAYRGLSVSLGETVTEAKILSVPLNGGQARTILALPFEEVGSVAMFPDGRKFVCTVYSSRSDVWVVENFDVSPESKVALR